MPTLRGSGGSKEGASIRGAPSRPKFFRFDAVFAKKIGKIKGLYTPLGSWHPLREILDQPLVVNKGKVLNKLNSSLL